MNADMVPKLETLSQDLMALFLSKETLKRKEKELEDIKVNIAEIEYVHL